QQEGVETVGRRSRGQRQGRELIAYPLADGGPDEPRAEKFRVQATPQLAGRKIEAMGGIEQHVRGPVDLDRELERGGQLDRYLRTAHRILARVDGGLEMRKSVRVFGP